MALIIGLVDCGDKYYLIDKKYYFLVWKVTWLI
jgi:hypothetical protein